MRRNHMLACARFIWGAFVGGSGTPVKSPFDISGDDDEDDEEAVVTQFGHLNVGFTPGMDGVRFIVLFTMLLIDS